MKNMAPDPYMMYYHRQQQQQHQHLQNGGTITQVFRGSPNQRGHGVGSFLGGMFRTIAPLVKNGLKAVGGEAMRSSIGFLRDIAADGTIDPKMAANARMRQFTESLKRKADDKLSRVLNGGGGVGGPCAKRRRVARKNNAQRATRKDKRVMRGTGGTHALKVTPQSLTRLLRGKTYNKNKNKKKKSQHRRRVSQKKKKTISQRRRRTKRKNSKKRITRRKSVGDIFS